MMTEKELTPQPPVLPPNCLYCNKPILSRQPRVSNGYIYAATAKVEVLNSAHKECHEMNYALSLKDGTLIVIDTPMNRRVHPGAFYVTEWCFNQLWTELPVWQRFMSAAGRHW